MNRICLINKGETMEKVQYLYDVPRSCIVEKDSMLGEFLLLEGNLRDDVCIVENYQPYYIKENTSENITALKHIGYKTHECGAILVAYKEQGIKYSVKPMESIGDIAKKFNISKEEIMKLNKLNSENLFIGQLLIL